MQRQSGKGKQHCPCQCHWDLSWLHFGDSRIAVSDVDGLFVVERRGHFLFIETKGLEEPLTEGQRILLEALSLLPRMTVVIIYGQRSWPEWIQQVREGSSRGVEETDRADVQRRIDSWYARANGQRVTA